MKLKKQKIADGWHKIKCEFRKPIEIGCGGPDEPGVKIGVRATVTAAKYENARQVAVNYTVEVRGQDAACNDIWGDARHCRRYVDGLEDSIAASAFYPLFRPRWEELVLLSILPYVEVPVEQLEVK